MLSETTRILPTSQAKAHPGEFQQFKALPRSEASLAECSTYKETTRVGSHAAGDHRSWNIAKPTLQLPDQEQLQTLILAGGRGSRLRPLTDNRPKPAVSFGGVLRIIDFTLSNCFYSGIRRVSLLTQFRHIELQRYIRKEWSDLWSNREPGVRSPLVCRPPSSGKTYRGTADAVFQNCKLLQSAGLENVLILSADHIYHMDYRGILRQHAETGADLTIATVEHPLSGASQFGVVEVDRSGMVTRFEEKPVNPQPVPSMPSMALVNMGVYVFKKKLLLESLQHFCESGRGSDFGHDILPWSLRFGRTVAFTFRDDALNAPSYWRDIGTVDAYYETNMELVQPQVPFNPCSNALWQSKTSQNPFFNEYLTALTSRCRAGDICVTQSVLSADVELADGVTVDRSVLMPGVHIGKGARLRRAIVDEGVHIPEGFEVGYDLGHDRRLHTVTDAGVVVVTQIPTHKRPDIIHISAHAANSGMNGTEPMRSALHSEAL